MLYDHLSVSPEGHLLIDGADTVSLAKEFGTPLYVLSEDRIRENCRKYTTAFRKYLLNYYPDRVWRLRIAEQLHEYASSFQVNYARCMTRRDTVAAELCRAKGIRSAMELFFLLKREYPPYYKWTYRALSDLDGEGSFSAKIKEAAEERIRTEAWEGTKYLPNRLNYKDRIVSLSEEIASEIEQMLVERDLIKR